MSEELKIAIDNISKALKEFEKVVGIMVDSKAFNKEYTQQLWEASINMRKLKAELLKLE